MNERSLIKGEKMIKNKKKIKEGHMQIIYSLSKKSINGYNKIIKYNASKTLFLGVLL